MVSLMHAKLSEQVRRWLVSRGASFPLPKSGVQIVALGHDRALSDVERLSQGIQLEETSSQLQV